MFVVNQAITLTYAFPATDNYASYALSSAFDLVIKLPDKTVAYDNDISDYAGFVSYTAPTATTDGELVITYNPGATNGLHELILSTGTSTAYTELNRTLFNIVEKTTTRSIRVSLD